MRDLVLAAFIMGMLPMVFKHASIGALLWVWISMMNPHSLTYGFAARTPWAMIIAVVTLIGLLVSKDRRPLPKNGGTWLIIMLTVWMSVTSLSAMHPSGAEVLDRWIYAMKMMFMLLVTFTLLRGKQINWLVWTMVVSVGYYGAKGGLWTLLTGGAGRVWGPPGGVLSDNNQLAVGLVIILPWMFYLRGVTANKWIRHGLLAGMVLVAFGILGSQSRGALLSLAAMALMLGIKSKRFIRTTLVLGVVAILALAFMPDSWTQRMDTIQSYQADSSAMSRIWTWKTLWNAAVAHPITGVGFRADNVVVFALYAPTDPEYDVFKGLIFVAHSIYLQALGEHGFVGLALYLGLGFWTWFAATRLSRETQNDPEFSAWVPLLMRMTQASLVGFAIGGAFLSLMMLDLSFYIPGVVVLAHATVTESRKAKRTAAATPRPGSAATAKQGERHHVRPGNSLT